tara:strand:- start:283 stop:1200 length:918 start_codon:yes stop_codon:yes gene_type:complete
MTLPKFFCLKNDIPALRFDVHESVVRSSMCPTEHVHVFDETLLIVMFNHKKHIKRNFALLKRMYGVRFPNMKYCSDTFIEESAIHAPLYNGGETSRLSNPLGSLSYQCTLVAMERFPRQFSGYLSIADDVLLNMTRISELPLTEMWLESVDQRFSTRDMHAEGGRFALWSRLEPGGAKSSLSVEQDPQLDARFRNKLVDLGWFNAAADIYYFPESTRAIFLHLAPIFLRARVYFSNAVPTMMQLIQGESTVRKHVLRGISKWFYDKKRIQWQEYLPNLRNVDYYHPLKLSHLGDHISEMCAFVNG